MRHGVAPADNAVVRQQNGVVAADKRQHGARKFRRPRSFVRRERNFADEYLVLGDDARRRHSSRNGVSRRMGWVAVHYRLRLRYFFVYLEVEQNFARAGPSAGKLIALQVHQAQTLRGQVRLAYQGRSAEDLVGTDAA